MLNNSEGDTVQKANHLDSIVKQMCESLCELLDAFWIQNEEACSITLELFLESKGIYDTMLEKKRCGKTH